jgi:IclR family acetate operon transcriptional repressor
MQNVVNTLRVLEEVAIRQPVGVGELARSVGMPKSSAQRALNTLHTAGWIRPANGGLTRWMLTAKALHVGRHATGELSLRDAAVPIMEELRRATDETIHLMVPEGGGVVLIERLQTPRPVRIILPLGKTLPLHASANGKAVLAASLPDVIEGTLGGELPGYTDTTITDPAGLRAELTAIRERGYATNGGEWRSDIAAVAAAVIGHAGTPIASLSISAPITRMPPGKHPEYGKLVCGAANNLGRALEGL